MRRMPGRDAHYLYEDRADVRPHTVKLVLLDTSARAAPLDAAVVRTVLAPRVLELAPLRERVVRRPLAHPLWADGGPPDLEHHIRDLPLVPTATGDPLAALVAGLVTERLPRERPLWRLWVISGLPPGEGAIAFQAHHAALDGHAVVRVLEHLLGSESESESGSAPGTGSPRSAAPPPVWRRLLDGLRDDLRLVRGAPATVGRLRRATARVEALRGEEGTRFAAPFACPAVPWNARPDARRTFAHATLDRAVVDAVADRYGVRRNDVLLTVVAGAARRRLLADGRLPAVSLTAAVPVSLRAGRDDPAWGNDVGDVFLALATDVADDAQRLRVIGRTMRAYRRRRDELDLEIWKEVWEYWPLFRATYLLSVAYGRLRRRPTFSLIVSCVSGPRDRLALADAPVTAVHSAGMLTEDLGLNVTTWSHADVVSVGVVSCPRFGVDVAAFAAQAPRVLDQLAA